MLGGGTGTGLRKENADAESPYGLCVLQVIMPTLLNARHKSVKYTAHLYV
jgi:hypothetical protein